ncbi:MAG: zf-HC2 domain-containing protein [Deltaproteobacteria bacterium]|nr:MAG: zf-HC2 domain-containing protein [Deltaproteobacteria bacterium]
MRCRRAQRWMVATVDGELAPRRRRMLEGHVASCPECRRDLAGTGAVLERVAGLGMECEVPSRLEQATLRRIRLLAAAEEERSAARGWWTVFRAPALALATAAVAIAAVVLTRGAGDRLPVASRVVGQRRVAAEALARERSRMVASREGGAVRVAKNIPAEPPPELAAAPELFMELPILRNLEKLEHFEAIRTTTLDDGGAQSNG